MVFLWLQGFPEADIQSLKEAVQLSRQEAVEALRHTKGDVQKAFINELASMHLNVALVDDLVLAYAAHRCCMLKSLQSALYYASMARNGLFQSKECCPGYEWVLC